MSIDRRINCSVIWQLKETIGESSWQLEETVAECIGSCKKQLENQLAIGREMESHLSVERDSWTVSNGRKESWRWLAVGRKSGEVVDSWKKQVENVC